MGRAGQRLAAISIDLDEVHCYSAIHGLEPLEGPAANAIYAKAVPRFEELFDELDIPATFFAIAADTATPVAVDALRRLAAAGHEIASHSLDHLYDLTRRDRATQTRQVVESLDRLQAVTGARPVGFRAPGYTITDALLEVIAEAGLRYDSSVFPCPPYYGAKAAAIGAIRVRAALGRGKPSHSIVDDPRVLTAPADPYRIGRPYWRRGDGLLELPIGVSRGPRLPYIGTSVVLAGTRGADWLTRSMIGRPLVNLELHGIDLADADMDGLQSLAPYQPDLRVDAAGKEAALRAAVHRLQAEGYRFVRLADAADAFS